MKVFVILLVLVANVECFLEIGDLRKMVTSREDRWELQKLEHNMNMPRNEIAIKVAAIVSKQPREVQEVYKRLVESDMAKEEAEYDMEMFILKNRGAPRKVLDLKEQMHNITMDMRLSRSAMHRQIRQLKRNMAWRNRQMLDSSPEE